MAGKSDSPEGAENENGGDGIFGGEASLEIWGMWRPRGSSADVSSARSIVGLPDAVPRAAVSSRVASGIQLREDIVSAAGAAYEAETEARAAAGLLLLQHLFSPSVSLQMLRPESYGVALAASIRTLNKWSQSSNSAVASEGLMALACIFQSCAAIEGAASRSAGRTVAQIIDRERGWEVVLGSMQASRGEKLANIGGAGSIWGLARWSRAPREQMLAWMRMAAELLLSCLDQHGSSSLDVAKACSAALHLLCWRFPVHSNRGEEDAATDQGEDTHGCRQLDLSGANAEVLLQCLDAHSNSAGLLLHVCGLLMLSSLAMRDRHDGSRDTGARAVRAGLSAVRCVQGAKSGEAGQARGGVGDMVADRGWELLLVMSDWAQRGGEGGNGQGRADDVQRIMVQEGVLDAVWGVIRTGLDANDAKRHEICWRIGRNLDAFEEDGGVQHHALEQGGLDTMRWVLPVLREAMKCGGLVEVHAWAVDTILRHQCPGARDSNKGGGGHSDGCVCFSCSIGKDGAVTALSGAMSAHPRLAGVQSHALSAMLRLSRGNQGNTLRAVRSGAVARAVDAIRGHMKSRRVQECAGRLLQLLCSRSPQAMEQLQSERGVAAVIESMRYHGGDGGEKLVGILCGLLQTASWGHEHRRTVAKEGGVAVVIQVMQAHPESVQVQRHACGCLHALSWSAECKAQIFRGREKGGGILLLVKAMMMHTADADLQQQACSALAIVSYFVDTNKREICECGGIQAIIYAMQKHSSHRGIQEQGCLALWSLASRTPPPRQGEAAKDGVVEEEEEKDKIHSRNKASMANGRGIEVLVAAVRSHPRAVAVVERASRALVQLSHNSHENASKICSEDGLAALCNGIKANVGSALVSEQAVAALKNVFSSVNGAPKGSKREVSRAQVEACIDAVLRSMGRHLAHAGLQRQACSALGNIALSTEWANAQMDGKGAAQAIISAMLSCYDDAEVQGRACQTLYVLSRDKANGKRMRALNRSESGARRPCHVMLRALGRHSRSTQVAKWSMSTVIELSEPVTARLWSDLANRCGFKAAAEEAQRGNAVWGGETGTIVKLWVKLNSL